MKIFYSSKFAREYRKLLLRVKKIAEKKEQIFRKNPFDPRLKTHKLKGSLKGFLSFSINQKYRIIFEFLNSNTRATARGGDERSSSTTQAIAQGEDERSSSTTRAERRVEKNECSSTTVWFHSVGEHSIYKLWD